MTPEREKEIREQASEPFYLDYVAFTGNEMKEALAEIDRLRADLKLSHDMHHRLSVECADIEEERDELKAANAKLLEFSLHEGNRIANAAADRHTELVLENEKLRARVAALRKAIGELGEEEVNEPLKHCPYCGVVMNDQNISPTGFMCFNCHMR